MALYSALTPVLEAHQWHRNGDHPEDRTINRINTGRVIQRHPTYRKGADHRVPCYMCGNPMGLHGVINPIVYIPEEDTTNSVCPGDYIITHRSEQNGLTRGYTVYKQQLFDFFYGPYKEPTE